MSTQINFNFLKPPPPVGAGGGYMFSGRPSVPLSVRPCVRDSGGSFMFPRYLQYLLTDFRQTFVSGASRDRDELIRFWGQKVKVQGHTIAAEAQSTRRYRRVQLFLVYSMYSRYPPSAYTKDLSSAPLLSTDASITHFQCCVPNVQQALLSQNITFTSYDHTTFRNNK